MFLKAFFLGVHWVGKEPCMSNWNFFISYKESEYMNKQARYCFGRVQKIFIRKRSNRLSHSISQALNHSISKKCILRWRSEYQFIDHVTIINKMVFVTKLKKLKIRNINMVQMRISVFDRIYEIVENGQYFCKNFAKPSPLVLLKLRFGWQKEKNLKHCGRHFLCISTFQASQYI